MEIVTFYEQGTQGMEMSLNLSESHALAEAVAQRVLWLLDEGRAGDISDLDEQIINCKTGFGIDVTTLHPDGLIHDLEAYHAETGPVLDALVDRRHGSRFKHKWKLDARQRLRAGRAALNMAATLRSVQGEQDLEIIEAIDALGTYEEANPDDNTRIIRSCHAQTDSLPVCDLTRRLQRRSYHRHLHTSD